jgi:glycosyltransferase involved in cell wall biosynthesis
MLRRLLRARRLPLDYLLGRAEEEALNPFIYVCARLRWPGGAAFFFRATVRILKPANSESGQAAYDILLLSKAMVTEDVLASFQDDPRARVSMVSRNSVKALSRAFLPAHMDENNYVNVSDSDAARARAYRRFLVKLWRKLDRRRHFDAVLTGNFAYFAERELAGALEELGIPFIVIMKESIKNEGYERFWTKVYRERRGPFAGRRILVYGESERSVEVNSGIIAPDRITITGMPRLDFVHRMRRQAAAVGAAHAGPLSVLFFMFGPKAFIPVLIRKRSRWPYTRRTEQVDERVDRLGWTRLVEQTQRAIHTMATRYPDLRITIKTKGAESDKDIATLEQLMGVDRLPDNIRVVVGGSPQALIFQHDVVCGFNSTSLLEALAAGKPVVVPHYAEALEAEMQPYLVDLEDAVEYAESPEELAELLVRCARERRQPSADLPAATARVLDKWLFNSDGQAGLRVREAVLAEIAGG